MNSGQPKNTDPKEKYFGSVLLHNILTAGAINQFLKIASLFHFVKKNTFINSLTHMLPPQAHSSSRLETKENEINEMSESAFRSDFSQRSVTQKRLDQVKS